MTESRDRRQGIRMNKKVAFLVGVVEPIGNSGAEWRARGRAYETVHVGDVVYFDEYMNEDDQGHLSFEVSKIITYGEEVSELPGMMTGDLYLHGQRGDLIRERAMLFVQ